MKVILGSDKDGNILKEYLAEKLKDSYTVIDTTPNGAKDFVESVENIINELNIDEKALGIAIDAYGAGSFIAATKHKGIIAAEVSDERSAFMTREHNNSRLITIGSEIVGPVLAYNIATQFLSSEYAGSRHQIRVDMLNEMITEEE